MTCRTACVERHLAQHELLCLPILCATCCTAIEAASAHTLGCLHAMQGPSIISDPQHLCGSICPVLRAHAWMAQLHMRLASQILISGVTLATPRCCCRCWLHMAAALCRRLTAVCASAHSAGPLARLTAGAPGPLCGPACTHTPQLLRCPALITWLSSLNAYFDSLRAAQCAPATLYRASATPSHKATSKRKGP
jgi:hypothetical protein